MKTYCIQQKCDSLVFFFRKLFIIIIFEICKSNSSLISRNPWISTSQMRMKMSRNTIRVTVSSTTNLSTTSGIGWRRNLSIILSYECLIHCCNWVINKQSVS
jgi:hypothetical protein